MKQKQQTETKMRLRSIIFILLPVTCIIMLQACKDTRSDDNNVPIITVDPKAKECKPDEFFDSYSYTILETNDSIILPRIENMDVDENHILITTDKELFVFNRDGTNISKINIYGQGPGELVRINDAKLMGDEIVITGWGYNGVLRYSLDGNYIGGYPCEYRYYYLTIEDDNIWLGSINSNFSLKNFARYDVSEQEITCQLMDYDRNESNIGLFTPFLYSNKNSLFVTKRFDNTVYQIDSKECTINKAWEYDFLTENKLSDFDPNLSFNELSDKTRNTDIVTDLGLLYKNGDIVYQNVQFFIKIGYYNNLFKFDLSKPSEPVKLLRLALERYTDFPYLISRALVIKNDEYITSISAYRVLAIEEEIGQSEFKNKGLTEDSNPVIFFHHFK